MVERGAEPRRDGGPFSSVPGMDPGADWLLGPGLQDFLPPGDGDAYIPFIVQVQDAPALGVLNGLLRESRQADPQGILPFRNGREQPEVQPGQPVVAYARKEFFDDLARGSGLEALRSGTKRIQLGLPLPASALAKEGLLAESPVQPPEQPWPQGTVVIGVIDDGIAFAHQRFRRADADSQVGVSRVEAYWNQDGILAPGSAVLYGREFTRQEINKLLQGCAQGGWVDEDKLYRRAGLHDFTRPVHQALAWRAAHGTHVLDLAAGYDPADERTDRPIIAVQLRVATTASQSGAGLETDVLKALHYICDTALRLTKHGEPKLPVVVNFSYGTQAGPHDGTSPIEEAIEAFTAEASMVEGRQVQVVLPAGNSHEARCHAAVAFGAAGETVALHLRVQPDDQTPSTVEVWMPHADPASLTQSRMSLSIETPDGTQSGWIGEEAGFPLPLGPGNAPYGQVGYTFVAGRTQRGVFRLDLHPTTRVQPAPSPSTAPAGVWVIRLRNEALAPSDAVHAWIERDGKLHGYPRRGRQSYFDEPCYRRWDAQGRPVEEDAVPPTCPVQRAGMLNGIGAGPSPVVIGGYVRSSLKMARYSAGGPATPPRGGKPDPGSRKPDAVAVSDDSRVHGGVLGAGTRSGSVLAMNGTSVTAPQVTRWLADRLAADQVAADPLAGRDAVKQQAMADEAALPTDKPPLPAERGGWGRLGTGPMRRARYWR